MSGWSISLKKKKKVLRSPKKHTLTLNISQTISLDNFNKNKSLMCKATKEKK